MSDRKATSGGEGVLLVPINLMCRAHWRDFVTSFGIFCKLIARRHNILWCHSHTSFVRAIEYMNLSVKERITCAMCS